MSLLSPQKKNALSSEVQFDSQAVGDAFDDFFESLHPFFTRALVYLIAVFMLVFLLWAWYGRIDIIASAPFKLVPQGKAKRLQSPRSGEVIEIGVKEGDAVSKGQLLFRLQSQETLGDLEDLAVAEVRFKKAQYDLEVAWPKRRHLTEKSISDLQKRQKFIFELMQTYKDAMTGYVESDIVKQNDASSDRSIWDTEVRFRSAEFQHLKERFQRSQKLFKKKLISKVEVDEARIQYLEALSELPTRISEIQKYENVVQDLERQILEAQLELDGDAYNLEHNFQEAKLRLERSQEFVNRTLEEGVDLIMAPEAGVVTQVYVNTENQVVEKGYVLASLVPDSAPVVAELLILNKDVGLLKQGQPVKLKYDAFPFQDYGIKIGRLERISPDAIIGEGLEPIYRGIVRIEDLSFNIRGEEWILKYGMRGTAEIIVDQQSMLKFVLMPLRKLHRENESFQE